MSPTRERFVGLDSYDVYDIAPMMIDRLNKPEPLKCEHDLKGIGANALRQLADSKAGPRLRLSASGSCIRQLAYSWHMFDSTEDINAASRMTFSVGDLTESVMVALIREVFASLDDCELLYTGDDQSSVNIEVPLGNGRTLNVGGHPDGLMILPAWHKDKHDFHPSHRDGDSKIRAILEVKSMSDYGFKKFRKEGLTPDNSYYGQVQAYMLARSMMDEKPCEYTYIVAWGKTSGAKDAEFIDRDKTEWRMVPPIHGEWVKADPEYQQQLVEKFRSVALSYGPDDFERPYGPGKKGKLGFPCSYCSYMKKCFPGVVERADSTFWRAYATKVQPFIEE